MAQVSEGLFVELKLIANEWSKGVKDAQAEAKELEKSFKPLKQAALDLGAPMAAAGTIVVGALLAMTKQAADYGDAIRDAAIRTNTTTSEMSAFKYLAEQSGTSVEALQKGLTILAKNAFANSDAFKQLGIDTKDSNGQLKSSKELFAEVSDKLSVMKDSTGKTGIELALFGKSATQLQELLNGGSSSLDAATAATERFGTAVGTDAAAAADRFNDTLNDMGQAQLGLSTAISQALLPFLTDVAVRITNLIIVVKDFANAHPELIKNVLLLGGALAGAGGLLLAVGGVLAVMPLLATAFTLLTGPIGITVAAIAALVAAFAYFPSLRAVAVTTLETITKYLVAFGSMLGSVGQALYQLATGQFKTAFETMKGSATKALNDGTYAAGKLDDGLGQLSDSLKSLKAGFEHIPAPVKQVNDGLETTAKKTKAAFDAADALTIKFGEMRGVTMKVADELAKQAGILANLDSAIDSAAASSRTMAAATREWDNTIVTLNADLKNLPLKVNDANAALLMIKPPVIDIGPTPEQVAAAKQHYDDVFASVQDTAKHVFIQMFEDGKFHLSALTDLGKGLFETLWTEVLSSFTAKLLTPLVDKITTALSGALSHIPGLGGILGGGASAAGGAVGSAGGGAGGIVGGLAGTGFSLAGSLITGGLAAVGGILGGILGNDKGAQKETAYNTGYTYKVLAGSVSDKLQNIENYVNFIANPGGGFWGEIEDNIGYWSTQVANVTDETVQRAADRIIAAINNIQLNVTTGGGIASPPSSSIPSLANGLSEYVQYGGGRLLASGVK